MQKQYYENGLWFFLKSLIATSKASTKLLTL